MAGCPFKLTIVAGATKSSARQVCKCKVIVRLNGYIMSEEIKEENAMQDLSKVEQITLAEGDGAENIDEQASSKTDKQKIDVLLKATGNAPIMKKKKWTVDPDKKIGAVIEFIKKYLRLETSESLFLYVNQAFAPSPDQTIKNLYDSFGADGKLVLHYCKSQAWG